MPVNLGAPEAKPPNAGRISVTKGLEGQDDNIDLLEKYFKEMQKSTVETSTPDDFLSFATCAHYFGVIMFEEGGDPSTSEDSGDEDAEGEPEEDSEAVSESAYPASSAATSPPASAVGSTFSIINPERAGSEEPLEKEICNAAYASLSEQDRVLKWREAFMADIEEEDGELMLPPSPMQPLDIGLGEDDEKIYYKGKGKAPEFGTFLIPHSQGNLNTPTETSTNDDPDSFINWPDDTPVDDGFTPHEGPSSFSQSDMYIDLEMDIYSPVEAVIVDKEFGREYLEPEQYDTPVPELPEIPPDPKLQAMLYDSAIKHRDELRARRIAEYERKKARQARQAIPPPLAPLPPTFVKVTLPPLTTTLPKPKRSQPIGLIYLWTSQTFEDPLHIGECSLGFYIAPAYRKKEHLVDALNATVKQAFKDKQCHRLQAILVENDDKLYTLELLTASGFRHEGTRRRAFFSPFAQEWKDVTYFAMLATEWVYDNNNSSSSVRLRTASLWDEILTRHQREFDELHRLEQKTLKHSTSAETIRQAVNEAADVDFYHTYSDTQSTAAETSASESAGPGPSMVERKKLVLGSVAQARRQRQDSISSGGGSKSGLDGPSVSPVSPVSPKSPVRVRYGTSIPSSSSPTKARKRSVGGVSFSSPSSSSSSSSQWDLLDDEIRNSERRL